MKKFIITKPNASKGKEKGKHVFYKVGDTFEAKELPPSLKGKAKFVEEVAVTTTKSTAKTAKATAETKAEA